MHVTDGVLDSVEPCFRGQSVLAPSQDRSDDPGANALDNRILHSDEASVEFQSVTFRNPTTRHPQTSAIVLEISGDDKTVLAFDLNGRKAEYSIGELLDGARSMQLHSYSAEAFLVRRAVPEAEYRFYAEWTDTESGQECDVYDVEIRQANGQCAWLSPVYVLS